MKLVRLIATGLFLWALSQSLMAAQGITYGGPVGGTDIQNAYLPGQSGFYGALVNVGAYGDALYGNSGKSPTTAVNLPAYTAEFALLYVYPFKVFGGTLASSIADGISVGNITVNGRKESFKGLNDIYTDLFTWSKHLGSTSETEGPRGLTVKLGYAMILPVGKYNTTDLYTAGHNIYIYIPNFALTYLTRPNFLGDGLELSAHFFLDISGKNSATQYRNGIVGDVDMAISEIIGPWQVGIAGYYARQFSDDVSNGETFPGNRFGSAGIGPVVGVNIPQCKCSLKFKAQFPIFTRNALAPNSVVLVLSKAFN